MRQRSYVIKTSKFKIYRIRTEETSASESLSRIDVPRAEAVFLSDGKKGGRGIRANLHPAVFIAMTGGKNKTPYVVLCEIYRDDCGETPRRSPRFTDVEIKGSTPPVLKNFTAAPSGSTVFK